MCLYVLEFYLIFVDFFECTSTQTNKQELKCFEDFEVHMEVVYSNLSHFSSMRRAELQKKDETTYTPLPLTQLWLEYKTNTLYK